MGERAGLFHKLVIGEFTLAESYFKEEHYCHFGVMTLASFWRLAAEVTRWIRFQRAGLYLRKICSALCRIRVKTHIEFRVVSDILEAHPVAIDHLKTESTTEVELGNQGFDYEYNHQVSTLQKT